MRAAFSKEGRAIYISHLDLMRTMQRAVKRSGIPVWYSEGFNPRIYLNFPLPLPLGTVGRREPMDFYVTEEISFDEVRTRLGGALPEGLHITDVYAPVNGVKDITNAEYLIRANCPGGNTAALLGEFFAAETLIISKHSKKRGTVTLDIKQFCEVRDITPCGDDAAEFTLTLPAGTEMNINAGAVTDSFITFCAERDVSAEVGYTERTKILCAGGEVFV